MELTQTTRDIKYLWSKIKETSVLEEIKTKGSKKDEVITRQVPSLSNMAFILDNEDFNDLSISKFSAIEYITQFHTSYINGLVNA